MTLESKTQISIVSYTNTLPFRLAIETSPEFLQQTAITYDTPANCAYKLINREVDVGLVPVGVLPDLNKYYIVSNYCIGANGRVDSVKLYGQVPVEQMDQIVLDYQSKTSIKLMRLLAEKYWNLKPFFVMGQEGYERKSIKGKTGVVVIGDRAFQLNNQYEYEYDLAYQWYKFTGLPFVFAVWVSLKPLPKTFENMLNSTLKKGITQLSSIAESYQQIAGSEIDLYDYLTNSIDYHLDARKRKGMDMFLSLLNRI